MNMHIIFNLDGCGVYYDTNEPLHLDALLAWVLAPRQFGSTHLDRSDVPDDVQLPLLRSTISGREVWHASALFAPQGTETLRYWRKKFRASRAHLTAGNPNLMSGSYREYNVPVPLLLISRLEAWASGDGAEVRRLLREVKSLGKKRAYGYGRVSSIDVTEADEDYSLIRDGRAMRWLPDQAGWRSVRTAPPYWSAIDRVQCCEVGERR